MVHTLVGYSRDGVASRFSGIGFAGSFLFEPPRRGATSVPECNASAFTEFVIFVRLIVTLAVRTGDCAFERFSRARNQMALYVYPKTDTTRFRISADDCRLVETYAIAAFETRTVAKVRRAVVERFDRRSHGERRKRMMFRIGRGSRSVRNPNIIGTFETVKISAGVRFIARFK